MYGNDDDLAVRHSQERRRAIVELLKVNSLLLGPRVRFGGGIPQDEQELRITWIRIRRIRIEVIIAEDSAALGVAARAHALGHQLVERPGVMPGTGSVPMGRRGGRHGDDEGRRDGSILRWEAVVADC